MTELTLEILHTVFIDQKRIADFTTTKLLREMLAANANEEDLVALMSDRYLFQDKIEAIKVARELLNYTPEQGYLGLTSSLQQRFQYAYTLEQIGQVDGFVELSSVISLLNP